VVNAGSNTLAQALIDYQASHAAAEVHAFVAKLRVFENGSQITPASGSAVGFRRSIGSAATTRLMRMAVPAVVTATWARISGRTTGSPTSTALPVRTSGSRSM